MTNDRLPASRWAVVTLGFALAATSACARVPLTRELQLESSSHLKCPADQVEVTNYQEGTAGGVRPTTWDASGCGRRVTCRQEVPQSQGSGSGITTRTECTKPNG